MMMLADSLDVWSFAEKGGVLTIVACMLAWVFRYELPRLHRLQEALVKTNAEAMEKKEDRFIDVIERQDTRFVEALDRQRTKWCETIDEHTGAIRELRDEIRERREAVRKTRDAN